MSKPPPGPGRNTPGSHARRVTGRIGTNAITWLKYQVEHAVDVTPETLAHILGQFKKLRANHGRLHCLPDDLAEREYLRIAYRLNAMRIEAKILQMPVTAKGYDRLSKTLAVYAAAALKYKPSNGKGRERTAQRKAVPTAATRPDRSEEDAGESSDA